MGQHLSRDEFRRWAEGQRQRYERIAGEPVAMSPEHAQHVRIKNRVWAALDRAIRAADLPCEALGDGMTVEVDEDTDYEPDAMVNCGPLAPGDAVSVETRWSSSRCCRQPPSLLISPTSLRIISAFRRSSTILSFVPAGTNDTSSPRWSGDREPRGQSRHHLARSAGHYHRPREHLSGGRIGPLMRRLSPPASRLRTARHRCRSCHRLRPRNAASRCPTPGPEARGSRPPEPAACAYARSTPRSPGVCGTGG